MATQPPTGTPFGLEQNVAAGLAYLLGPIGAIIMLVGGGTNAFVKWAAAQSLMLAVVYIVLRIVVGFAFGIFHFFALILLPFVMLLGLLVFAAWLWTSISAFQGKEVRLPVVADLTTRFFSGLL